MTRALRRFAAAMILFTPLSCDAHRNERLNGGLKASSADPLMKRITLDVEDASIRSVLRLAADILEADLEINPATDREIRFACDNITARTALNAICESGGCWWELSEGDPRVLRVTFEESEGAGPPQEPRLERIQKMEHTATYKLDQAITLDLAGAPAPEVLSLIAQVLGTELKLDEALSGESISIRREGDSCRELLDQICEDLDCDWELIGVDERRPLLVLSKSKTGDRPKP